MTRCLLIDIDDLRDRFYNERMENLSDELPSSDLKLSIEIS
jgi:hypothetical protein